MVAPIVTAALIGGGASLLGGALASRSQSKANDQNAALQREFAQYGIRWKVKDAKAAGIHPLFAMGASTNAASPSYQSDPMGQYVAQAGTNVANLMESASNRSARNVNQSKQRQLVQSQIQLEQLKLKSQMRVDEAEANYKNALAAQIASPGGGDRATAPGIQDQDAPLVGGLVREKPNELPSADKNQPEFRAGIAPGWQLKNIGPFNIVVPETDEGWGEDLGLTKMAVIALATSAYYAGIGLDKMDSYIRKNYKEIMKSKRYREIYKAVGRASAKTSKIRPSGTQKAPRPQTGKIR